MHQSLPHVARSAGHHLLHVTIPLTGLVFGALLLKGHPPDDRPAIALPPSYAPPMPRPTRTPVPVVDPVLDALADAREAAELEALLNGTGVLVADEEPPSLADVLNDPFWDTDEPEVELPYWLVPGGEDATDDERAPFQPDHHGYPSRRALEAVLAGAHGEHLADYKTANAERSWQELHDEAQALAPAEGRMGVFVRDAQSLEHALQGLSSDEVASTGLNLASDPDIDAIVAKLGAGARSGRLEDYSRAELCKLLGYLQRDAKGLSDDDLRAMALDAHVVPKWVDAPSHATLALRWANRHAYGGFTVGESRWESRKRLKAFRAAMRMDYSKLCGFESVCYGDEGVRDSLTAVANLGDTNPLLAAMSTRVQLDRKVARHIAVENGFERFHNLEGKHQPAPGARSTRISPLGLHFAEPMKQFGEQFGETRLGQVVGHSGTGTWKQITPCRRTLAFYETATGDIHLHPRLDAVASRARAGTASSDEVREVALVLAHEVIHSTSKRPDMKTLVYGSTTSLEHTVEEGTTDALARLHADDLARRTGIWASSETLHDGRGGGCYAREVEAMCTVGALIAGDLDRDGLASGDYAHPNRLSEGARDALRKLHTATNGTDRVETMTSMLASRYGKTESEARQCIKRLLRAPMQREVQPTLESFEKVAADGSRELGYRWKRQPDTAFRETLTLCVAALTGDAS